MARKVGGAAARGGGPPGGVGAAPGAPAQSTRRHRWVARLASAVLVAAPVALIVVYADAGCKVGRTGSVRSMFKTSSSSRTAARPPTPRGYRGTATGPSPVRRRRSRVNRARITRRRR